MLFEKYYADEKGLACHISHIHTRFVPCFTAKCLQ